MLIGLYNWHIIVDVIIWAYYIQDQRMIKRLGPRTVSRMNIYTCMYKLTKGWVIVGSGNLRRATDMVFIIFNRLRWLMQVTCTYNG